MSDQDVTVFDKISTSAPVDKSAAMSMSRGFEYEPQKRIACLHWDYPPETRHPNKQEINNPSFTNYKGAKYGRFTVLGILSGKKAGRNGLAWVVRCSCGDYETRTPKAIRNASHEDRCSNCQHVAFLRRRASHPINGGAPR